MKEFLSFFSTLGEYESFLDKYLNDECGEEHSCLIKQLQANSDVLTDIFLDLKSHEDRKLKGQFPTPNRIVEFMVGWVLESGTSGIFVDPGCGSGRFTELLLRRGVDKVVAIDDDSLSIKMTKTRAKLVGRENALETFEGDFLDYSPIEKIRGIVCNPPYVRHHHFEKKYKQKLKDYVDNATQLSFNKLSGLHVHFYVKAADILDKNGRMTFITSSEFLDSKYGVPLKKFLYDEFNIEALILFDDAFKDVLTTSCISLLRKNGTNSSLKLIDIFNSSDWNNEQAITRVIPHSEINFDAKWSSYLYGKKIELKSELLVRFSDIASLKRGIATGDNNFFTYTHEFADENGLLEYSRMVLKSQKIVSGFILSKSDFTTFQEKKIPTLILYVDENVEKSCELEKYIRVGEKLKVHETHLGSHRNPWYKVDRRSPPDAFLTYMGRKNPKFILNEAQAIYLNNVHGLYLKDKIDESRKNAFILFLNSFFDKEYIRGFSKRYSGGMFKIEPKDLDDALTINPLKLTEKQAGQLSEIFKKLDDGFNREKMKVYINDIIS